MNITIEKIVNKGFGLGFHEGKPIFVYSGILGDILEVDIIHQTKKVTFAKIATIIEPSKYRIASNCSADSNCGGCDWLAIDYKQQIKFKEIILSEVFKNLSIGKINEPVISDNQFFYRNKSFMPVGIKNNEPVIGIFAHRSHEIIAHENCLIHNQIFDKISRDFISYIKSSHETVYDEKTSHGNIRHLGFRISEDGSEILVIVVTKKRKLAFTKQLVNLLITNHPQITGVIQNINPKNTNVILGDDEKILYGKSHIKTTIEPIEFDLHYKSFFQVNYNVAKKLYQTIKANVAEDARIIDAYCGIGSIGLFLASKVNQVWGIEENSNAIADANTNKELNRIDNIDFVEGRVESKMEDLVLQSNANTIIFDPPRKGLDKSIIETVAKSGIDKIIYVSCDPSTQRRDIDLFLEHDYRIIESQLFDMFPQTYHMEHLMILVRK